MLDGLRMAETAGDARALPSQQRSVARSLPTPAMPGGFEQQLTLGHNAGPKPVRVPVTHRHQNEAGPMRQHRPSTSHLPWSLS